jgi:hypothetical protein
MFDGIAEGLVQGIEFQLELVLSAGKKGQR